MIEVSRLVGIDRQTVRRLIHKWDAANEQTRFSVLFPQQGRGAKVKLSAVADILPELIEQHNRNLKLILEILEKEHSIKVCKSMLFLESV